METSGRTYHTNGKDEEVVHNFGRKTLREKMRCEPKGIEYGLHSCISGKGPVAGSCEYRNELSYSILKKRELLD
jgi:hypothetical protein